MIAEKTMPLSELCDRLTTTPVRTAQVNLDNAIAQFCRKPRSRHS